MSCESSDFDIVNGINIQIQSNDNNGTSSKKQLKRQFRIDQSECCTADSDSSTDKDVESLHPSVTFKQSPFAHQDKHLISIPVASTSNAGEAIHKTTTKTPISDKSNVGVIKTCQPDTVLNKNSESCNTRISNPKLHHLAVIANSFRSQTLSSVSADVHNSRVGDIASLDQAHDKRFKSYLLRFIKVMHSKQIIVLYFIILFLLIFQSQRKNLENNQTDENN